MKMKKFFFTLIVFVFYLSAYRANAQSDLEVNNFVADGQVILKGNTFAQNQFVVDGEAFFKDISVDGFTNLYGDFNAPSLSSSKNRVTISGLSEILLEYTLEFGARKIKQQDAGKIGYNAFGTGGLEIIGGGTTDQNRLLTIFAEGGTNFRGAVNSATDITANRYVISNTGAFFNGFSLFNGGKVGIGTNGNLPSADNMLEVNGLVNSIGGMRIPSGKTLEFGYLTNGKNADAGKIGYNTFGTGGLEIIGGGNSGQNRLLTIFAEGGTFLNGSLNSVTDVIASRNIISYKGALFNGGKVGIGTNGNLPSADNMLEVNGLVNSMGGMRIQGGKTLEFGYLTNGKQADAGKIGYNTFGTGALEIIGAGTAGTNRRLMVFAEGGTTFNGQVAINTYSPKDKFSATVNGPMFIGSFLNGQNSTVVNASALDTFDLWVEKGIVSEDFAFAKVADWKDKVFEKEYKLITLEEVDAYIKLNKHLPEIPSEKEIIEKGYSAHQMNKNFIQKIEELTLYAINQQKLLKTQQNEIEKLKTDLAGYQYLSDEIEKLKQALKNK